MTERRNLLEKSLNLFSLNRVDRDIYSWTGKNVGWKRVFGGQVMAQTLIAAYKTIDVEHYAHSFHSYFLSLSFPPEKKGKRNCERSEQSIVASAASNPIVASQASLLVKMYQILQLVQIITIILILSDSSSWPFSLFLS